MSLAVKFQTLLEGVGDQGWYCGLLGDSHGPVILFHKLGQGQ